jgi:amino acid adenylation domain-containing protein/non-ribosomal peptide synthase protein (TIGR01720 family)
MVKKLEKANVQDILELNMSQKGMLFHYLSESNENLYNVQLSFDIEGSLDAGVLKEAFHIVQLKNESLRSVFNWDKASKPLQIILKECPVDFVYQDFSQLREEDVAEIIHNYSVKDRDERFDLTLLPLRLRLIRTSDKSYVLNITHHHILYDGWSSAILLKELLYTYDQLLKHEVPVFTDKPAFRAVCQELQKNIYATNGKLFWKNYLKGYEINSFIPNKHSIDNDEKIQGFSVSTSDHKLVGFASEYKVTPASVIYAAFGMLLKKYNDLPDVVFGTTVSGRDTAVRGNDKIIGNFINTVPLRVNGFEHKSLLEIVTDVHRDLISRSQYSSTSYFEIKQLLNLSHAEDLFDAVMVVENYPIDKELINSKDKDFSIKLRSDYENTNLPLVIKVFFRDQLEIEFVYKPSKISAAFVTSMGKYFLKILDEIVGDPAQKIDSIPLLAEEEENQFIYGFNDTAVAGFGKETVLSLFEKQVTLHPDNIAQSFKGHSITYTELNNKANKIALYLAGVCHVKSGDLVGLLLEREEYLIPSILGILKAGAAYLPIDPAYPPDRINVILEDSALKSLITRARYVHPSIHFPSDLLDLDTALSSIEAIEPVPPGIAIALDSLAYVIYTSGSTGRPKGVMIEHKSLANYITWAAGKYVRNEAVTFPLYTSISFDLTVTSIFLPLITGNKVIIYEEDEKTLLIEKVVQDNEVNIIKLTPSHLKIISSSIILPAQSNIKRFVVGGENLETQLAKDIYEKFSGEIEIYNEYGPTEATVGCMIHKFEPEERLSSVPIGLPIANVQIYILDKLLKPCPAGITGELYISGSGLARGYLSKEELTKAKFIDNPFLKSGRMYKTGDFASRLPDGKTVFNGRIDDQVKVRGYRIELGEIAGAIKTYKEQQEQRPVLTDKIESFALDSSVIRCKNCLLTSNYPGISFNKDGICNICENYFSKKDFINSYFKDEDQLKTFFKNRKPSNQEYDCLLLFSGGKDSTYTLYKLMEMGLRVLTFTFDNGFISKVAFLNIKNTTEKFKVKSIIRTSVHINKVLLESLRSKSNACTGCWNSINSLGVQVAQEYGIDTIVSGLSMGQIIEMRLEGLLEAGIVKEGEINDNLQLFRKSFHSKDNVFFNLLKSEIDTEFLSQINFIDYFRYDPVNTEGVIEYLKHKEWVQPKDTGLCSTNCVINDVGIYMHWKKRGFHFYEAPLSWDRRLNVIEREKTIRELSDTFNLKKINAILDKIGFYDPIKIEDAIVTIKGDASGNKTIAAYYVSNGSIDKEKLKNHVKEILPEYMVPHFFIQLDELPLTANGKIDKKALPDPKTEWSGDYEAPTTKKEKLLAEIWTRVLGIKKVSITDNFFSLGGDSIKSIQISSKLRSIGYDVSVKDILSGQTIKNIATKVKEIVFIPDQSPVSGPVLLSPIQKWFFEKSSIDRHHFNQSVMLSFPAVVTEETIRTIFKKLQEHHDALRMVFKQQDGEIIQQHANTDLNVSLEVHDVSKETDPHFAILSLCNRLQAGIDLENGPLMKLGLFQMDKGSRLLIVIHHLVVDGISWRILFEDIETLYQQVVKKQPLALPLKTDSYQRWTKYLSDYSQSKFFQRTKLYWEKALKRTAVPISRDYPNALNIFSKRTSESLRLSQEETKKLLTEVHLSFNTQINDILLTALLLSIWKQYDHNTVLLDLEGHGREHNKQGINIGRTVGWFTSIYPVILEKSEDDLAGIIKQVKETLRSVPNNGMDYLVYKYADPESKKIMEEITPQISFNYLGQLDAGSDVTSYVIANEQRGDEISRNISQTYDWNIIGEVTSGQLSINLFYSTEQYKKSTVTAVLNLYRESLLEVIHYCCTYGKAELTPSDLTFRDLSIRQLDELKDQYNLEDIYPLSPMQEGMLFHSLLDTDSKNYFVQKTLSLKGNLDIKSLERSLNDLTGRYEILRTVFLYKGFERPLQLVLKERKVDFTYMDVSEECFGAVKEEIIQSYQARDKERNFDLGKDVLMRATVLRMAENEFEFIWSYHHIVMDGWCTNLIWNDFKLFYSANKLSTKPSLPPVKKYADYITWLEEKDKEETVAYWTGALQDYTSLTTLPRTEIVAVSDLSFKLKSTSFIINKEQTTSLHKICSEYGVTINTVIQCAWGLLLAKYNNTNDIVFGLVVSGRSAEIEGIGTMVGLFINTIPVRIKYKPEGNIGDLLQEIQHVALENERHHYHPLQEIQSLSALGRELLDHIMVFENYPTSYNKTGNLEAGTEKLGFSVTDVQLFEQTNYDLSIVVHTGEEISIRMDHNAGRYSTDVIEQASLHFEHLIGQIILHDQSRIADIDVLQDKEKQQLLLELNNTPASYPEDKTIIDLFTEQVRRTPGHTAIKCGEEDITYAELDKRSTHLGILLRKSGVKPDDIVGLLMDRSPETVIGMLGILKAGGAYLPIDTDYPEERIEYLVKDSGAQIILTTQRLKNKIPFNGLTICIDDAECTSGEGIELTSVNKPSDLCYIIYTSGTTGNPKGVMIEHKNVVRLFFNSDFQFDFNASDVWTMFHSPCFDFSVWEMYGALLFGGKLVIIPRLTAMDTKAYLDVLKKEKVTILNQTPSAFYNLMHEELYHSERNLSLRYVIFGGEALSPRMLKPWWSLYPHVRLVNMFGITETTVHVTYKEIGKYEIENGISNIGKPIPTLTVYILDKDQKLMPRGVIGELHVGGAGVARGYLGKEELTAQKFISNPLEPGERLYRSGDLARILNSGDIEYIGRMDDQVKIRGFRIELGEIEAQLSHYNGIKEAVIIAKEKDGNKYLTAYYVADNEIERVRLKTFLKTKLPDYMVPTYYVHLESLPLTSNGKLDKKALPEPVIKIVEESAKPKNEIQKELVRIWADLLGIGEDKIGVNTNFFDVGGNSLKLVKMVDKINRQFNAEITVAKVFTYPVISLLAAFLQQVENTNEIISVCEPDVEMNETIDLFNQIQG